MKAKKHIFSTVASVAITGFLSVNAAQAAQITFSPDGIDSTYSLGQFKIQTTAQFGNTSILSPILFDSNTQINHTLNTFDTNKVFTQVTQFNMTDGVYAVTAGTSAAAGTPDSIGLVTSLNSDGTFPASSIFNMYVNVTGLFGPSSTDYLYNKTANPLLIGNPSITQFPPDVVYTHQNSSAVAMYIHDGVLNDTLFGYLVLSGHGVYDKKGTSYTSVNEFQNNNPIAYSSFTTTMSNMTEIPLPTPLPPAIWLFGSGLVGLMRFGKRKTR